VIPAVEAAQDGFPPILMTRRVAFILSVRANFDRDVRAPAREVIGITVFTADRPRLPSRSVRAPSRFVFGCSASRNGWAGAESLLGLSPRRAE